MHKYGEHRFPFAHTLTSALYTIGIALPVFTYRFYHAYGLSGELLLLGAFLLHGLPITMLLTPPPNHANRNGEQIIKGLSEKSDRDRPTTPRTCSKDGYIRVNGVDGGTDDDDDDDEEEQNEKNVEIIDEEREARLECWQDQEGDSEKKIWRRVISQVLYLDLLVEERVWSLLILPVAFILNFILNAWSTIIFSFTLSCGIDQADSIPLLLMGAFGGFSSRLFFSFLLYHHPSLSTALMMLSVLLLTVSLLLHLMMVTSSVFFLYFVSFLFKMALNGATVVIPPLTGSSVARDNFASAQSMFELMRGIASLTGGVLTGKNQI